VAAAASFPHELCAKIEGSRQSWQFRELYGWAEPKQRLTQRVKKSGKKPAKTMQEPQIQGKLRTA